MKLTEFLSQEEIREDLEGNDLIANDETRDINDEIMEALESYSNLINSSLQDNGVGLSTESINAINIGINLIKTRLKDMSLPLSLEDNQSTYTQTLIVLSEIDRLKEYRK